MSTQTETDIDTNRDAVIKRIKTALQRRSGKSWSVTGGRGTAWGWITIDAPPSRRTWASRLKAGSANSWPEDYEEYDAGKADSGSMSPTERQELATLLGLDAPVHFQGVSIASSHEHYREYVERAEGRTPDKIAQPYWD